MSARFFLLLALFALLLTTNNYGQSPQSIQTHKVVEHGTWSPTLEQTYNITEQEFKKMGLGTLTIDQLVDLLAWIEVDQQKAKASVPRQFFDCGRPGTSLQGASPEAYDNVRVYVNANGKATQIISGVRERLRTMNGIEVVYTAKEADLSVSLVAMNLETVSGYQSGVAVSVDVVQPCELILGTTSAASYDVHQDQFLEVGANISTLVNDIVSTLDTNDFDGQRKQNASYKKFIQDQKK